MSVNKEEIKNSLFGNLRKKKEKSFLPEKIKPAPSQAKWNHLEKVNVRMREEQKDFLDAMARKIMKRRASSSGEGRERITTNSILRALIDCLEKKSQSIDLEGIDNEHQLRQHLQKLFK